MVLATRTRLLPPLVATCPAIHAPQAEQALRAFNNSLPAAASWLLSLGTSVAAATARPAAVPAAAAATAASADEAAAGPDGGCSERQGGRDPRTVQGSGANSGGGMPDAAGGVQHEEGSMPALQSEADSSEASSEALSDDTGRDAVPTLVASSDGGSISTDGSDEGWEDPLA